ncbi:MAG TPA: prenyltransferase/squalene oxidase repeat-containing protein [Solirubrobacterales bacterium]|nr:prenyltransferase/squalene oxidase repeat-containing protein [Solirubrobacterales bacterium]
MATYGGDLSWRHFLVLEARAIPFEVAHVLGNVALALVAGPAMVRMLVRFRERFEWERGGGEPARAPRQRPGGPSAPPRSRPLGSGGVAAVLLLAVALLASAPAPAEADSVSRAADWLEAQQRPSGGFAANAEREAGVEMTSWAMLGLAAAGRNPLDLTKGGKSPVDFLRRHLDEVRDAGDVARTILARDAAGVDPRDFGGENLVARLLAQRRESGSYQGWPATSAYAVLALRAADANDATAKTVAWLRKVQGEEGGWGNEPQQQSTAEITGAVLQVLSPESKASDRALDYMRKAKRPNGGFAPGKHLSANAQATSWASQGLLAAGKDPVSFGTGKSSFTYMRELQAEDGHFMQSSSVEGSPVWVTADVLVSLSGHHLPVAAPPREPKPKRPKSSSDGTSPAVEPAASLPSSGSESGGTGGASPSLEEAFGDGSGGGSGSGGAASKGGKSSGGLPEFFSGEGAPEGEKGADSKTAPSQASGKPAAETGGDSNSSTAGAILLGLLAGSLLFALGLAGRRGWMRWRYGL